MKNYILLMLIGFCICITVNAEAAQPKFKMHELKNLLPGVNYSVNFPVVIDYDGDKDQDILFTNKEGTVYLLENLQGE